MTGADVANLLCAAALFVLAAVVYRAWLRPPARTRVTVMPAALTPADCERQFTADDEEFLADLTARMQAYGEAVADYYDTEGNQ
jgi:hypothetical protein